MFVDYKLSDGQVRPAVVVKWHPEKGKADLHVFLTKNDYANGVHENHVRSGFAQLQDVARGEEPGTWSSPYLFEGEFKVESIADPEAETVTATASAESTSKTSKRSRKKQ